MAKVIAFSGSHGTGKTTTINALKTNPDVIVDDFKVSREVQKALGYDRLEQAYETFDRMVEFQNKILEMKFANDKQLSLKPDDKIYVTERSFVDVAVYTAEWIRRLTTKTDSTTKECQKVNEWYREEYHPSCIAKQIDVYAGTIFIPIVDAIAFVEEANRADSKSRQIVHDAVKNEIAFLLTNFMHPAITLLSTHVEDRALECNRFIDYIKHR